MAYFVLTAVVSAFSGIVLAKYATTTPRQIFNEEDDDIEIDTADAATVNLNNLDANQIHLPRNQSKPELLSNEPISMTDFTKPVKLNATHTKRSSSYAKPCEKQTSSSTYSDLIQELKIRLHKRGMRY